jgi:hypothetical protein
VKKRDMVIKYFEHFGYTKIESRSKKYLTYGRVGRPNVYIGENGTIRIGNTVTESIAVTTAYWSTIEQWRKPCSGSMKEGCSDGKCHVSGKNQS